MPTTHDFVDGIRQACLISCREEDETEPYKNKYQAADLLKKLLGERAICADEEDPQSAESNKSQPLSSSILPRSEHPAPASDTHEAVSSSNGVLKTPQHAESELAAAAARIRCGLILLETDLLADGQSSIEAGLSLLEKDPGAFLAWLLESYNALGALYSERGDLPVALEWLKRAEDLYQKITGTGTKHAHLALPIAGRSGTSREGGQAAPNVASVVVAAGAVEGPEVGEEREPAAEERLAGVAAEADGSENATAPTPDAATRVGSAATQEDGQCAEPAAAEGSVEGQSGADVVAAVAVGDTNAKKVTEPPVAVAVAGTISSPPSTSPLPVQLPDNDYNAVQSHYTKTLYYLAQVHGHMKSSDRSALYCAATLYRQLASGKYDLDDWVNNCLQLGGYYAKVHAYGLAMYCHAAAQAVVDRDTAAGAVLGEDIAANIKLATARVHSMRLAASHNKYVEGKELEMHYPDVTYFPDYLRFAGLSVPSPDTFPWGPAALATSFDAARELLNTGMPYFKAALSYYQLDGWVTDHVGIVMDMSNMYRCLAGFEADPSRAAAMHRCRAQLLEPLSGALNPDHYQGLSRSIDLELAHVYREISDARDLQGGQAGKVSTAAATASKYYQRFLRSFASSETGTLPDRVDPDNEPYFLMASFGLGRMIHRMRGGPAGQGDAAKGRHAKKEDGSVDSLVLAAHNHLRWTSEYVRRHGLDGWTQEAQAAEELSELLVEQMRLRAMMAARRGGFQ